MKAIITAGFASFLLLAVSCTKENNTIAHSSTISHATDQTKKLKLGQHYGGGIIFYLDTTKQHGLIADTADLPNATWWYNQYLNTGATGLHNGNANTHKIVNVQGTQGSYAALECSQSKRNGYKDWFLPSKIQLNNLYRHKDKVGNLFAGNYWSSTEQGNSDNQRDAYAQSFIAGAQFPEDKSLTIHVRAIREF